jgi:uncharacterized protein (DUF2236 family)
VPGIRDVSGEAILLAGGGAAILQQLANPVVCAGVAGHSDFAERPLDRLHGTLTYLYVVVFGTEEEVRRIARDVGRAHAPVRGARDDGPQLWVAATLYETARRVHELVLGPWDEALLHDYAVVGTALGMPRASWPADQAAFDDYWRAATREVDDVARSLAHELLHPRAVPWWIRMLMPAVRAVTAGLLEPELREAYRLPFDERRFVRLVRIAQAVYPRLPRRLRQLPRDVILRRFRRAAAR